MKQARVDTADKPRRKQAPPHLLKLQRELGRGQNLAPATFFTINTVILGLAPVFVMVGTAYYASAATTVPPYLVPIVFALGLAALGLLFLLARRRLALLREYERALPGRIREAGLIQQLARGFETLPDIFVHTAKPWRLLLGGTPQTTEQQVQLLLGSLDWYLLPEPRPHFRQLWKGLPFVLITFAGLVALMLLAAGGMQHAGPPTPVLTVLACVLAAGLAPVAYFGWQALYVMACGVAGGQALAAALREYLEEQ
jgi:MYXO-CTERM domain-containing protein